MKELTKKEAIVKLIKDIAMLKWDYGKKEAIALVAQAMLECGNGLNSGYVKKYNNLFGMNHPSKRPSLSFKSEGGEYGTAANYKTLAESVEDRILWDKYNQINPNNTKPPIYLNYIQKVCGAGYNPTPLKYSNEWYNKITAVYPILKSIEIKTKQLELSNIDEYKPTRNRQ